MFQDLKQLKDSTILLQTLAGFWLLSLVVIGACGSILKLAAPDGWLALALGRSVSVGVAALASMLFVGAVGWFAREWASPGEKNRLADFVMYAFAGAGLLFLWQIATGAGL